MALVNAQAKLETFPFDCLLVTHCHTRGMNESYGSNANRSRWRRRESEAENKDIRGKISAREERWNGTTRNSSRDEDALDTFSAETRRVGNKLSDQRNRLRRDQVRAGRRLEMDRANKKPSSGTKR